MPTFSLPGVGYTLRALITMETFKLNAGKELEVWLNVLQLQHALTENVVIGCLDFLFVIQPMICVNANNENFF